MRPLLGVAVGLCACAPPTEPGPLIDPAAARVLDAEDDPWPEPPGASPSCHHQGVAVEDGALEVDTGRCPYAVIGWTSLRPVAEGDPLRVSLAHGTLASLEPAEGHALLAIDGEPVWERTFPIPAPAALVDDRFPAPFEAPEGSSVVLHLHNHGANTWRLYDVRVEEVP